MLRGLTFAAEEGKAKAKGGEEEVKKTGGVTKGGAAGASERAKTAAKEAFEAWQARNRLPAETDEDLLRPIPEPLVFIIDSPELLDDDMKEILEMSEVSMYTLPLEMQPEHARILLPPLCVSNGQGGNRPKVPQSDTANFDG